MGILVSWINTAWAIADAQLTAPDESDQQDHNSLPPSIRDRPFDFRSDHVPHPEQPPSSPALTDPRASLATAAPSLDLPPPPSPRDPAATSSVLPATTRAADNRQHLFVSSDYDERTRPVAMAEDSPLVDASSASRPTPSGSPPPPPPPPLSLPSLRIDVAVANDPTMDHEMTDASFVSAAGAPDASADLCFDDEGLSALEKIYLFARSSASFHRVFISRSLPVFLPDVPPCDAVEYVIPLMNGLAMDEDEAVKEALVEDLVSSIWWFLTRCQVVDYEVSEGVEPHEVPLLNVQSFTPLLGTLLLNPSANVNAPARHCIVNLLTRIRDTESGDAGFFGPQERKLFEHEIIQQVVIGMAHLDTGNGESPVDEAGSANAFHHEPTDEHPGTSSEADIMKNPPPPSAADDEVLLSTLTSSAHSLATTQFLAQEEPSSSRAAALAAIIQRPPSPIPTVHAMVPFSECEPEFAHLISTTLADTPSDSEDPEEVGSPMKEVTPMPPWAAEPMQALRDEDSLRERVMQDISQLDVQSPYPEHWSQSSAPALMEDAGQAQLDADGGETSSDFNEEQAAIGKLASMSLMAAVTASGPLDLEFQSAFVKEVESAGHDSVYWVRREATFALGALAKVVPEELLYLSLLPLFDAFCDDSVWNVRQSVLFALPAILSRLPFDARRTHALRTIQRLSVDPAPQVRTGLLEVLGEVLFSFHEDDKGPPDEIIRLFIGEEGRDWHGPESTAFEMLNNVQTRGPWTDSVFRSHFPAASNDVFGVAVRSSPVSPAPSQINLMPDSDPARPLICAFNLPAVVLTLGSERWPELRGLYLFLARTGTTKVRQTLAASIGEVARIIGPEHARRDLMYRWWDFARGRDAAVRTKALEALEVFLLVLGLADRARLTGSLEEIWDNHLKGWREREVLARALDRLAPLFPSNGEVLRSLLRRALRDATAAVRVAAIEAYPQIYGCVLSRPEALKLVTEEVSSLAYDESFKKRLTYVECVKSLITHSSNYDRFMDESFWHSAVALASDKIVDVRISVARLLSIVCDKILSKSRTLPGGVLNIVRNLSEDPASDVRAFVSHILAPDLRPPTELMYGYVSESSPSMATFSRPPPKREARTIVSGIGDMKISGPLRGQEQVHQPIDRALG